MNRFENRPGAPDEPEEGTATPEEIEAAIHSVTVDVPDVEQARAVVESLEKNGVPTTSIELVGAETEQPHRPGTQSDLPDSEAFTSLSKSTIVGGAIGIVVGALLGLAVSAMIPALGAVWGLMLGGVFGAAVGGAAGGMSVARYGSRAWSETYQVKEEQRLQVAVHHASADVVAKAEEVMSTHVAPSKVRRVG